MEYRVPQSTQEMSAIRCPLVFEIVRFRCKDKSENTFLKICLSRTKSRDATNLENNFAPNKHSR